MDSVPLTVALPTYRREGVLLDTVGQLLELDPPPAEVLILDQTRRHEPATDERLQALHVEGRIRWFQLDMPSIPRAMNRALLEARREIVLFVDDDIRPEPDLIDAHLSVHQRFPGTLIAGRVIQPWEEGKDLSANPGFRFAGTRQAWIEEFMGGNFSVPRDPALALGGFDENFVRVAYRFEAEFAHRWRAAGHRIYFEPRACIHHLKARSGGTRSFGEHLTTVKPDHSVGTYYYHFRTKNPVSALLSATKTMLCSVATRHHLRRPWWIPVTLIAELSGLVWATLLALKGPKLIGHRDAQ